MTGSNSVIEGKCRSAASTRVVDDSVGSSCLKGELRSSSNVDCLRERHLYCYGVTRFIGAIRCGGGHVGYSRCCSIYNQPFVSA